MREEWKENKVVSNDEWVNDRKKEWIKGVSKKWTTELRMYRKRSELRNERKTETE